MARGGWLVGVFAAVLAIGGAVAPAPGSTGGSETIRIFSTPPVLVRAGERVLVPVDAVCEAGDGTTCPASVTVAASTGTATWTRATANARADLMFDLSAPALRASTAGGSVAYTVSAAGASGGSASLGSASAPLHLYVVPDLPRVEVPEVPFGHVSSGRTVLFLPWGTGPLRAGIVLGLESPTMGPSSFDVDRDGRIHLLDTFQHRVAVFDGGRLVGSTPVSVPNQADLAVTDDGSSFVQTSGSIGASATVARIGPGAAVPSAESIVGTGIAEQTRAAGGRAFVHLLPEDVWVAADDGPPPASGGPPSMGRPLASGASLLAVVHGDAVRLGLLDGDAVRDAVELGFRPSLGELALSAPDGDHGYLVVLHVYRTSPTAVDQYQVVRFSDGRVASTFAVPNQAFAEAAPVSTFRLGGDGSLYQLATSPDGVRIVRYAIGGSS